ILAEMVKVLTNIVNVRIYYEPFLETGCNTSELAISYYKKGQIMPSYDIKSVTDTLKSLYITSRDKISVGHQKEKWERLLDKWEKEIKYTPSITAILNGEQVEHYGCLDMRGGDNINLSVDISPLDNLELKIVWKFLKAEEEKYNIIGKNQGCANNARRYIKLAEREAVGLRNKSELILSDLLSLFDSDTGFGTIRLFCEVIIGKGVYRSNVLCLSRYRDESYLGKLTEIFNLPYIYGSALLRDNGKVAAEAKYGADCANFIIYGLRRMECNIPYAGPMQLRKYLVELDEVDGFKGGIAQGRAGTVAIFERDINIGLLLCFNGHVAALYEDREPRNILDLNDLVVHQLETYPEIISLKNIKKQYIGVKFPLMKYKKMGAE
ncbi:MAG: hypothetical protein JSU92_12585, partial [Deltaproteobacteria bacterium]